MRINRRYVYLVVALVLAGLVFWTTQAWLESEVSRVTTAAQADEGASSRKILVASRNVSPGTILTAEHLQWASWPDDASTDAYFEQGKTSLESVAGSVARNALFRGEPVAADALAKPGEGSVMSAVLRPGYRAVALDVSASTGVAGFVAPGDRVDLILTRVLESTGAAKDVTSDTVLRDVRVVGVDQKVAKPDGEVVAPQTATIEVTPAQAELVVAASELGKLTLALRSVARGEAEPSVDDVSPAWLSGGGARAQPGSAAGSRQSRPAPAAVEVVRGTSVSVEGSSR